MPVTKEGSALNFIPVSKNVKATFPGERRFNQYDHWERITGKFLGPGSYNDHETKLNLKAQPCAVKIVSVISYLILSLFTDANAIRKREWPAVLHTMRK